ncbi:MAG: penicillin-binding transpeptidase domain-containing protein [Minisyncoccia bacterium]
MKKKPEIPFEDSLNDDWGHDLDMVEVPLGTRPVVILGAVIACIALIILGRVAYLNWIGGAYYAARATDNADQAQATPAPRGIIYDAEGDPLVTNKAVFDAVLDARLFISDPLSQSSTIAEAQSILGVPSSTVWSLLDQSEAQDFSTPVVLAQDLDQSELVNLQALGASSTIKVQGDFERYYPNGPIFSSVVGYVGRVSENDLANNSKLTADDFVGKMGIEEEYDTALQGAPGVDIKFTDAHGKVLGEEQQSASTIGGSVHLTIDGGLQTEMYDSIAQELAVLGRQVGVGLAINPQTGAVLGLVNLPGFDNNAFENPASSSAEIQDYLISSEKPLFNRIISGQYQPGSTIKPLDSVAALKEDVITPDRELYSPGYLMVPDPYNSSTPTRYADWESHGYIDLASALAQSSDVYFYIVGGGSPEYTTPPLNNPVDYGINGLGAAKLYDWWTTFGLGKPTGIDLPSEAAGFLPTPAWWSTVSTRPWSLGDTYNVSIGQGSLAVTPVQLLSYIDAIANGGTIYKPFLNASDTPVVSENLTYLLPQIQAVQQGMLATVSDPRGTAYTMDNLPAQACAKTGSAQVQNNQEENALFVGYFPCTDPQIALLILIENSKQGSLNAVPIAKNVFDWYYYNRIAPGKNATSTAQ